MKLLFRHIVSKFIEDTCLVNFVAKFEHANEFKATHIGFKVYLANRQ